MKKVFLFRLIALLVIAYPFNLLAQEGKIVQKPANALLAPAHRIIFQLTSGDTLAHKILTLLKNGENGKKINCR